MSRKAVIIACCVLLTGIALAQGTPSFEVASVRPAAEQLTGVNVGLQISGSQVRVGSMSLRDYVAIAYRVRPSQVSGPDWLGQTRFDITARIPEGVSSERVPDMLQTLLAQRFELTTRRESREFPVYALAVAPAGFKLQPLPPAAEAAGPVPAGITVAAAGTAGGVAIDMGGGSAFRLGNNRLEVTRMGMPTLADLLERFLDRPVVDSTGLSGQYDLTLDLTPEEYMSMLVRAAVNNGVNLPPQAMRLLEGASGDSISGPLQKVGLTLESRRAPLEVIVVDSIRRSPTEN